MTPQPPLHVAVIGAGILGTSTAAHLARTGARVTLVTSGKPGDGASGRSIAWLNSSGARSTEYRYLRLIGIDRYRTWKEQHPESSSYLRFDGALKWGADDESFRDTFAYERAGGYDSVWVEPTRIAEFAPDVDADAVAAEGAIFNPGEGWVNLPDLIAALLAEAVASGVEVIEDAGDVRVDVRGDAVVGVVLGDGTALAADRVVLATGGQVPAQLAALGVTVPDATPAAFVVMTEPVEPRVRTVLNTPRVAVRPMPDGRLVLDADWAEKSIEFGADGSLTVPDASVQGLLEEGARVLAGNPRLTVQRVAAGLKPIPGDGEPVVGAVSAISGLYTLFTHSGATLGLILGELLAEEIVTGRPSPVLDAFRLDRFDADVELGEVGIGAWAPVTQQ
ncbi:FAD-binding oxidoreductase [Microbacterium sp. CBA3102]|uniref:NAD(P)/FAD-dependent oxidoreductase n=1 Tax=Microbacterium sp. CBA3102 TaxID=2603598 RepID=UPI0011BB4D0F|nr:FAD-binding oxidoreductase [Microbacterium sp. CBA3102]QEA29457.1 FAD-binding oxidoreductase [Microbacterium sp. CBA3102]